jgi:hypothetical protein
VTFGDDKRGKELGTGIINVNDHFTLNDVALVDKLSVIPHSEIARTKPPNVCPGCFIHMYSNNMINRFHVQNTSTLFIIE